MKLYYKSQWQLEQSGWTQSEDRWWSHKSSQWLLNADDCGTSVVTDDGFCSHAMLKIWEVGDEIAWCGKQYPIQISAIDELGTIFDVDGDMLGVQGSWESQEWDWVNYPLLTTVSGQEAEPGRGLWKQYNPNASFVEKDGVVSLDPEDLEATIATWVAPGETKCECGAAITGSVGHSTWCPLYEKRI